MLRIAVGGAHGRMGNSILKAVHDDEEAVLAAAVVKPTGEDTGLEAVDSPVDVYIDFTTPEATIENLEICKARGYAMVIGTTGFTEAQKELIKKASAVLPIVFSPNMSIGMNVMYKLLEIATHTLKDRAEIGIIDIHHKHKKDAPSGTALKMRRLMTKAQGLASDEAKINIASLRLGDLKGEHRVVFALEGEEIDITHRAVSAMVFARGAVHAAKWLQGKKPGLYDMQDVLGL
jgi:4-hydroxy-tetrahydrodipicolinate reductase